MTKKSNKTIFLGVKDRLYIPQLLPEKGTYLDLLTAKHIERKVEFSSEELAELKIRQGGGGIITWDVEAEKPLQLQLTEQEQELLNVHIDRKSEAGELPYYMIETIEKLKNN